MFLLFMNQKHGPKEKMKKGSQLHLKHGAGEEC